MKKLLCVLCAVMLVMPSMAFAEEETETEDMEDTAYSVELDYEADPDDFVGEWTLVAAYTADDGVIDVEPDSCFVEMELSIDANKLVDETAYIHADATNLSGTMSFDHDDIDVEDYKISANWEDWTIVNVIGEGEAEYGGANKLKIRDDDDGIFFDVLTGLDEYDDEIELMNVIGLNEDGQLIIGYSEDHIESDEDAEWEYAYIFNLNEDAA